MAGARNAGEKGRKRVNGEGTIYQRASDDRWVGMAYVHTTSGARKRRVVYGWSFDEVRDKLDRLQGNSANGVPVPDRSTTIGEYLNHWLRDVVSAKRPTTHRGYESAVRLHITPVLGRKRLDRLTAGDVRQLMAVSRAKCLCCANRYDRYRDPDKQCCSAGRCCGRTPSKRQIQFIHAVLRNALSNAVREELVTRNVAKLVQIPAPRYRVGKGLEVAEVKRLLREAKRTRLYALYVVAATLGLRRGELLGLRWSDLDLRRGSLAVVQTVQRVSGALLVDETKSEASDSVIPLPKITQRVLARHRKRLQRCYRFGRIRPHKITDHALDLVGVAGFEPTAPRSQSECATKLRHTPSHRCCGASRDYRAGANAACSRHQRSWVAAQAAASSAVNSLTTAAAPRNSAARL